YDGTEKPLVTVTGTPTGGEMQYALGTATEATEQYTTSIPTATEAGTYTVWYKVVGDANHSDTTPASVGVTINQKEVTNVTIELSPESFTYDGTAKEPTVTVKDGTTVISAEEYNVEYSNNTNAGTATVTITDKDGGNYTVSGTKTFTISPKTVNDVTVELSQDTYTYDGTAKQPTVTVKDGTTVIPASEYNVEYSSNTNAGTATVTITDKTGGNYIVSGEKTFTIERGSQSAPVVSSTNETIEGKADGTITGVTDAMEYKSAAANAYTSVTGTTIANLPAGTYNVRYKETHNYNASPAADVVINNGSKLTVQFDADGGSPEPDSQQLSYSQTVSAPAADPEKTGYTFKFWSADGEAEYDFSTPLTANITLKAVYQANSYTITFDTDGGSDVAAITQDYGTAVTAPADPTKTGYTFAGWDKEIPATMPAESMTITAQWTVNRYTMTFDDNGSHSEYVLDYGTNLTEYVPDIQWEGHTFMGWNPEVPETVPAEDMTFTAVWDTNEYTITFDSNGGSYIAPIVQDFGTKVIAPMNPMREGFAFIGWDKEIPATMPAYDMTVRALWVETPTIGVPRISSGTARIPSGTAQPEVTVSSTDEITPRMWAVLNDDNSVTVSWEKIKNASSYILYVEKDGKAVKLTETTNTEVTLKNAKNGATYKFSLKYTRNDTTYSAPKGYKANLRVYYKPAVTATVTKDGKILLKWNKVANADKYVIYRVNSSGRLIKAGITTKTAARIAAKSTDTGYVVRAYVNGKLTKVTKSDIATAE
ncbi:MAG: InlB B-repeat-containing protein, partial [Oscillospiraceae bacterium]|nr:InlB B-repeat-containing protein [Oscillospiraceae bacterium]